MKILIRKVCHRQCDEVMSSFAPSNYFRVYWPRTYFYIFFENKKENVRLNTSCAVILDASGRTSDSHIFQFLLKNT